MSHQNSGDGQTHPGAASSGVKGALIMSFTWNLCIHSGNCIICLPHTHKFHLRDVVSKNTLLALKMEDLELDAHKYRKEASRGLN